MPHEVRNRLRRILDGLSWRHPSLENHNDRVKKPRWWKRSTSVQRVEVTTAEALVPTISDTPGTTQQSDESVHTPVAVLSGHTGIIRGIAFFPDGKRVASCSDDSTIRVWRIKGGKAKVLAENLSPASIAMFPKGDKIACACRNGRVKVLGSKSGRVLNDWAGRNGEVLCVAVSPNGQLVASGARDGRIVMREAKNGNILKVFGKQDWTSAVFQVAFSPDGTRIASAHSRAKLQAFDVNTGKTIFGPMKHDDELAYDVRGLVWSLDGRQLISACDNTIRKWDVQAQVAVTEIPQRYINWISSISLSPGGTLLACASGKSICISNSDSLHQISKPLRHDKLVIAFAFSPSGEVIASGGWDDNVSIWRVPRGKERLGSVGSPSPELSAIAERDGRPNEMEVSRTPALDNTNVESHTNALAAAKPPSRPQPTRLPRSLRDPEDMGLSGLRPGDWW